MQVMEAKGWWPRAPTLRSPFPGRANLETVWSRSGAFGEFFWAFTKHTIIEVGRLFVVGLDKIQGLKGQSVVDWWEARSCYGVLRTRTGQKQVRRSEFRCKSSVAASS